MSLLQTRFITEGSKLAFTGVTPEDGQTFIWGNAKEFDIQAGDVVQVLEINRREGSPWARVVVAILKGKCVGRVGQVMINMEVRLQRSWQRLTMTGSMEPVRKPRRETINVVKSGMWSSPESNQTTKPASPEAKATFAGDEFGVLSALNGRCG